MEQIQLPGGSGKGTTETEGLDMELQIPEISGVVKKIEDEGNSDTEEEIDEADIALLSFLGALLGLRNNKIKAENEKALKEEMDKTHPIMKILKGCGCGM